MMSSTFDSAKSLVRKLLICALGVLSASLTVPASAEQRDEFAPFFWIADTPEVIALFGEIDERATFNFGRILRAHPGVKILALNSAGGLAMNALVIADQVHQAGLETVILKDWECYSACSYIFFAGKTRTALGALGVHQVSAKNMGASDAQIMAADLLEGLARFGVSPEVITRMLRTGPDDMHIFSQSEIEIFGINRVEGISQPEEPAHIPLNSDTLTAARAQALNIVLELIRAHTGDTSKNLNEIRSFYAPTIRYFGKDVRLNELMQDKIKYFDRWPERMTTVEPKTVDIACIGVRDCTVEGVYSWLVSSPADNREASGRATFRYRLLLDRSDPIIEESGQVLR